MILLCGADLYEECRVAGTRNNAKLSRRLLSVGLVARSGYGSLIYLALLGPYLGILLPYQAMLLLNQSANITSSNAPCNLPTDNLHGGYSI